jgi:hypothetical protein
MSDRDKRFRKVVRMFMDGTADRWDEDAPMRRYAHVFKGSLTVCVTDSDNLIAADDELRELYTSDASFEYVGTIDLDDGDLVSASGIVAFGRPEAVPSTAGETDA